MMMLDKEDIEKFSGEWVLLFGDKVVNHSPDLEEILKSAEEFPVDEITIAKVPPLPYDLRLVED